MKERKKKPVWKRTWFIVLIVFFGLVVIGGLTGDPLKTVVEKAPEKKMAAQKTTVKETTEKVEVEKTTVKEAPETSKTLFDKFYPSISQDLTRLGLIGDKLHKCKKQHYPFTGFRLWIKGGNKYSVVYSFGEREKGSLEYSFNFFGKGKMPLNKKNTLRVIETDERVSGAMQSGFDTVAKGEFGMQDLIDVINGNHAALKQKGIVIKKVEEQEHTTGLYSKLYLLEKGKFALRFYSNPSTIEFTLFFKPSKEVRILPNEAPKKPSEEEIKKALEKDEIVAKKWNDYRILTIYSLEKKGFALKKMEFGQRYLYEGYGKDGSRYTVYLAIEGDGSCGNPKHIVGKISYYPPKEKKEQWKNKKVSLSNKWNIIAKDKSYLYTVAFMGEKLTDNVFDRVSLITEIENAVGSKRVELKDKDNRYFFELIMDSTLVWSHFKIRIGSEEFDDYMLRFKTITKTKD